MNEMQVFNNPEFGQLRTVLIDDTPWAVGKDVASALGYKDTAKAVKMHVDDEDKGVGDLSTPGGTQKINIINESGMYSLILSSKLPSAKRFKRWITSEVLPAIRRTGSYTKEEERAKQVPQREITVDDFLKAAAVVATCKNERLPYVLGFLKSGGFPMPEICALPSSPKDDGKCAMIINKAVNEHGLSLSRIAKATGLATTQITRIRTGQSVPTLQRAQIIIDAVKDMVPEIE